MIGAWDERGCSINGDHDTDHVHPMLCIVCELAERNDLGARHAMHIGKLEDHKSNTLCLPHVTQFLNVSGCSSLGCCHDSSSIDVLPARHAPCHWASSFSMVFTSVAWACSRLSHQGAAGWA